jgi:hypothetical protein
MENSWASEKVHFGCENPFCVSMAASLKSLTIVQVVFSAPPRFPSSRPPRESKVLFNVITVQRKWMDLNTVFSFCIKNENHTKIMSCTDF